MPTNPEQLARRLEPGVLVCLYELDLTGKTSKFTGQPGAIHRFHDGIDPVGTNIINFKGQPYNPFPIKAESFEWNTRGALPRPKLSVSNIASITSALLREFDDLVGAVVTVRRTFQIYLDGQPEGGSPYKEFTPLVFVVDRKSAETNQVVSFELATGMDAEGVLLPRRQILATACPWTYRGPECSYAAPVAGGSGWPVNNRLGKPFPGAFTDGVVPANKRLLQSATAVFRTTPSHLSDVGKVISGNNFTIGTKVKAVNSATQVELTVDAKATGTGLSFNINRTAGRFPGGGTGLPQPYDAGTTYQLNDTAYIMVGGIRVYAVSKVANNTGHAIYDEAWWMLDVCLKKLSDCEAHFGVQNPLPFGGFPGANKLTGG